VAAGFGQVAATQEIEVVGAWLLEADEAHDSDLDEPM
jgi:hypothetical protein